MVRVADVYQKRTSTSVRVRCSTRAFPLLFVREALGGCLGVRVRSLAAPPHAPLPLRFPLALPPLFFPLFAQDFCSSWRRRLAEAAAEFT
jgi:hypothetical protein